MDGRRPELLPRDARPARGSARGLSPRSKASMLSNPPLLARPATPLFPAWAVPHDVECGCSGTACLVSLTAPSAASVRSGQRLVWPQSSFIPASRGPAQEPDGQHALLGLLGSTSTPISAGGVRQRQTARARASCASLRDRGHLSMLTPQSCGLVGRPGDRRTKRRRDAEENKHRSSSLHHVHDNTDIPSLPSLSHLVIIPPVCETTFYQAVPK